MANITGSEFDDDLLGTAVADSINGLEGDDTISAGGGNDVLLGGLGNDVLDGGEGGDTLDGGDGDDVLYAEFDGVPAFGEVFHAESLAGGNGDDQIYGFAGRDLLDGGAGNDVLSGGDGADILLGGDGGDILDGGRAGIGNRDMFRGGAGNDTYIVDAGNLDDFDPTVGWVDVQEVPGGGVDTMILVGDVTRFGLSGALWQGRGYIEIENLTINGAAPSQIWGNKLNNQITGNDGANRITGYEGDDILTGRGGNDTYLLVDASDTIVEAAGGGTDTISTAIGYLLPVNVENLVLTGAGNIAGQGNAAANKITGNSGNNVLSGFGGDDTLRGGGGADRLYGGLGNDIMFVDDAGDLAIEAVNQGTDWVYSTISYTLTGYVENLRLLSGPAALTATGNSLANVILGNEAANTLDGKAGADDMRGGAGDDLYIVDNALDTVTETAAGGVDQINASVSTVLGANVENLTLTGAAAINGTGNAAANVLTGNAADNRLDGLGGPDLMAGGLGNDVYTIDDLFDLVTEFANEGVDRIESATTGVNLAFAGFANVENATLTGALSNNLTGNASANVLTGNAGHNAIDGIGGADTMRGGLGNDTYTVDNLGDLVVELANQGIDTVRSPIAYTLGLSLENLILTGTSAIDGTGNTLANQITGNAAANLLDGKTGADAMAGGGGNDTYVVDNAADTAVENFNQGVDTVLSFVSFTLSSNVERLTLTGLAAIAGTGNELANLIVGNGAANVIDGKLGADVLTGGLGKDIFVFSQVNAIDIITDFTPVDDTMRLSDAAFGFALTPGAAVTLVANATPTSAAAVPTFLYDTDNGRLYFDQDGTGLGVTPYWFAVLTGAPAITAADFQVVA